MNELNVGDNFPAFALPNQLGNEITLGDLAGNPAVIYFYPKDDTTGCTAEACGLRDAAPQLDGIRVLGVSPDSVKSHQKFVTKYDLNFDLLADTDRSLIEACGLWIEKSLYGKKYMGVDRTTFLLDSQGVITHIFRKVKPQGHEQEILKALGR